jgi:cystathionine gamma-synthase
VRIQDVARGASNANGKKAVTEDDVYLYPCGMSAIWHAHDICRKARHRTWSPFGEDFERVGVRESARELELIAVQDSMTYPKQTLLPSFSPFARLAFRSVFFGVGGSEDIPEFRAVLEKNKASDEGRILAVFCEFPSNPLLRSPDLVALRRLADEFGFAIENMLLTFHP